MYGLEVLGLARLINRLKRKYIAIILSDIEQEFKWEKTAQEYSKELRNQLDTYGVVDTDDLVLLLNMVDSQLPSFFTVRKVILDNINELARNVLQALLGDIEGYGRY